MEKQRFNLHTHTARCGHGEGLDIQYILSAIEAGFELLGFSEHIPFVELRRPECRMFYEHKAEYLASIRRLQRIFSNQLTVRSDILIPSGNFGRSCPIMAAKCFTAMTPTRPSRFRRWTG